MNEVRFAADGRTLIVKFSSEANEHVLEFNLSTDVPCMLHWGLRGLGDGWRRPAENLWHAETPSADALSVDTSLKPDDDGQARVTIRLPASLKYRGLTFVLFFPDTKRWVKDGQ